MSQDSNMAQNATASAQVEQDMFGKVEVVQRIVAKPPSREVVNKQTGEFLFAYSTNSQNGKQIVDRINTRAVIEAIGEDAAAKLNLEMKVPYALARGENGEGAKPENLPPGLVNTGNALHDQVLKEALVRDYEHGVKGDGSFGGRDKRLEFMSRLDDMIVRLEQINKGSKGLNPENKPLTQLQSARENIEGGRFNEAVANLNDARKSASGFHTSQELDAIRIRMMAEDMNAIVNNQPQQGAPAATVAPQTPTIEKAPEKKAPGIK